MPRIKTAPSVATAIRKPIHYHIILRPVLQRRFARSSLWTFVVCCFVSLLIGERYGFKLLLPWSVNTGRGLFLFAAVFPVLILRKADLHVQFYPHTTPSSVISREFLSLSALHGITAYVVSALSITLLYLRNVSDAARLSTTITRGYELPRLNERLVYLVTFSIHTAIAYGLFQRAAHRTFLPYTSVSAHLRMELAQSVPKRLMVAGLFALYSAMLCPVLYVLVRPMIWKYSLRLARMFIKMPRSSNLPTLPVGIDLIIRSITLAFLMVMLWESANLFFDAFIGKAPASQGQILSDRSDDANGTLITGLQNREKPFTQAIAFEELTLIANNDKARRQRIFLEHGSGTSTWNHILRASLEILADVRDRHVKLQQSSLQPGNAMVSRVEPENPQQLAAKQANIFVSKGAHKLPFDFVRSSDIPPDKSAPAAGTGVSAEGLWSRVNGLLSSPHALAIGWPFRACIELQATYDLSHVRLVVQAVQGISRLVVKSAAEDSLGMVQWDLGVLLNCLCVTLGSVESYGQTCLGRQSHTPIAFLQRKAILSEQDILAKTIRLAISDIVHVFGKYLDGMGLENDAAEICRKAWDLEIF